MHTDIFIDLSGVTASFDARAAIKRLESPELVGGIARRVTCAVGSDVASDGVRLPGGWSIRSSRPVEACRDAIAVAADDTCPLLVLLGDIQPSCAAVGLLLEAVESDPMSVCMRDRRCGRYDMRDGNRTAHPSG